MGTNAEDVMIWKKHIHLVDMMDSAERSSAAESIRTMIFLFNCFSFLVLLRGAQEKCRF